MAYSKEVVRRARQRLESAKADRESTYAQRLQEAYRKIPRLKEIDILLRKSMAVAAQAAFTRGGDARAALEQVKEANLALQRERQALVDAHFEKGYLDDSPICPHCGGSGYVGSTMCRCLQELCRQEQKKELTLLTCGEERFENFRLDYYANVVDSKYGYSPRSIMERCLQASRKYAYEFGSGSGNLMFFGGTGLGKTFLSAIFERKELYEIKSNKDNGDRDSFTHDFRCCTLLYGLERCDHSERPVCHPLSCQRH